MHRTVREYISDDFVTPKLVRFTGNIVDQLTNTLTREKVRNTSKSMGLMNI